MQLYKFLSENINKGGLKTFLNWKQLYLTPPRIFNDPFDCRYTLLSKKEPTSLNELYDSAMSSILNNAELSTSQRKGIQKFFHRNNPQDFYKNLFEAMSNIETDSKSKTVGLIGKLLDETDLRLASKILELEENISNKIGIISMSQNLYSILMWSHYARNHTGFCIELKEDHDIWKSDDDFTGLHQVSYRTNRFILRDSLDAQSNMDKTLVTKDMSWAYEEEVRFVALLENACDTYNEVSGNKSVTVYKKNIPPDCVKAIYFGLNYPKEYRDLYAREIRTKRHEEFNHVQLFQMYQSQDKYQLYFKEVPHIDPSIC